MSLRSILQRHRPALVVGNGLNRYGSTADTNSWESMLRTLARERLPANLSERIPSGLSLTEYYDLLDLESADRRTSALLQKRFSDQLENWQPKAQHERLTRWALHSDSPILTTNFDRTLSDAGGCRLTRSSARKFTDYYPWESYFAPHPITEPTAGFGIWHINGTSHYARSIRLGLSHYMGSVQRARGWLHKSREDILFSGKDQRAWRGSDSWLHIVFNSPLLFIGLGLEENEVFLRWLLIERAKYFRQFPQRKRLAWYAHVNEPADSGKLYFLKGVGVEPLTVESYDQLYSAHTWATPR